MLKLRSTSGFFDISSDDEELVYNKCGDDKAVTDKS